jgi:type II secretory pathway pseudopilin PulG
MKSGKRNFTLIELLMVVLVIAVLASLLLPAFAQAKRKSQLVVCGSNLKQLNTFHYLFTKNNKGNPVSVDTTGYYWEGDNFGRSGGNLGIMDRKLNYYIDPDLNVNSKLSVVNCPTDKVNSNSVGTSYYTNIGYIKSVFASRDWGVSYNSAPTNSVAKVKNPSQMMLVGEIGIYPKAKNRTNTAIAGHWAAKDENCFSLITVDGSLKIKQRLEWGATAGTDFDLQNN